LTPEAVVLPLQYAVAEKTRRDPGFGGGCGSLSPCFAEKRESSIVSSYSHTSPPTTKIVASALRQPEYASITRNQRGLPPPEAAAA